MKILILATDCAQTTILYNHLKEDFNIEKVIIEDKVATSKFFKNRIKKIGILRVIDQVFFLLTLNKVLKLFSKRRLEEIHKQCNFDLQPIPEEDVTRVNNINSKETITLINTYKVDCILVSGTRILSSKLINSINVDLLNLHAGITPDYRGVHGAYWALVNKEREIAGVTLHRIDKGVDTGEIIGQDTIKVNNKDNIITYPLLQLEKGVNLLDKYLNKEHIDKTYLGKGKSFQYYHPGLTEYLFNRVFKRVK